MFGISPKDRMNNETYRKWYKKTTERCKNQIGEKNPNYKNDTLHNKVKDDPHLRIQYYSRKGSQNGRSRKVAVYKDEVFIIQFAYIGKCCEWLKQNLGLSSKINSIRGGILESIRNCKPYHGFTFSYVD